MADSLYDENITSRSLIKHASQEVPKYSTPLPVLQPVSKKRKAKRRSALTMTEPGIVLTPRTLIKETHKEKNSRRSSPFIHEEDEVLQPQSSKSRSRRSLHVPVELYDDISVDENETVTESSVLPDLADISAISAGNKKSKLQLGKLDNRAYIKPTQKTKCIQNIYESPLEEEYDASLWNAQRLASSSAKDNLRTFPNQTRSNNLNVGSDNLLSENNSASNVNFNTEAPKGSPVMAKQKPFSEKQIPYSSDSNADLSSFPDKLNVRRKSRLSVVPDSDLNILPVPHASSSSGERASSTSAMHSSSNQSVAKSSLLTEKNILSHSLQAGRLGVSPFSALITPRFAAVSSREASSGNSDADIESLDEGEEAAEDQDASSEDEGEPEEILEKAAQQKSLSRNLLSQRSAKKLSSTSISPGTPQVSGVVGNASGDKNVDTSNDQIMLIGMPKHTTPVGQRKSVLRTSSTSSESHVSKESMHQVRQNPRTSSRKTVSASRNASKLSRTTSSNTAESPTASEAPVSSSRKKRLSRSSPSQGLGKTSASVQYTINSEGAAKHSTSRGMHRDSSGVMEEAEDSQDDSFEDSAPEPKTSKRISVVHRRSSSKTAASNTKSSSYNIINPPGIEMHGTPQVLEDASYQVGNQAKVNVSSRTSRTSKMSEQGQLKSPSWSLRPSVSGSIKKKMHSTAIQDHNATLGTIHLSSPAVLGDTSSQAYNQAGTSGRKTGRKSSLTTKSSWETIQEGTQLSESTSKKVRHSMKNSEMQRVESPASSVKSSVSGTVKNKMHSTAIADHNTTIKTVRGTSTAMSPIRSQPDSDGGEEIGSSSASSNECEPSPDDKEISLPPSVQNHDGPQVEEEVVATSAPRTRKRQRKVKTGFPRISAAEVKKTIEHYAGMKIDRGALNTVMESCDIFWENSFAALHDYATHAGREEIDVQDVELLLCRQGYANDRNSMNALIAKYMPMELRREVIPMATPGNHVYP